MGNDKTVSGPGLSVAPPPAIVTEPIVITAGQEIPEVKVASPKPSEPPVTNQEFKKLTAEVKNLGVNMEGFVGSDGNILPDKIRDAQGRIEAKAREIEKSNPTFAARLYKSALQLDPQNIGLRADTVRALRSAAQMAKKPEVRELHEQEAQGQLKAVEQRFSDGLKPVRQLLSNGKFKEAQETLTKLRWSFLGGLSTNQKKTLLDSPRFQSLMAQSTFALAQSFEGSGQLEKAKKLYQVLSTYWNQAIKASPQDAEAHRLRGELFHQTGRD